MGVDAVIGDDKSWGLGFVIEPDGFGMGGIGGSLGWASTADNYAFGFVTGSMGSHERAVDLDNAVRRCIGLPPVEA